MTKLNTLAVALCCGSLALTACSKGSSSGTPDAGSGACASVSDCSAPFHDPDGGTRPQVCVNKVCVPTCSSSAQCTAGNVCENSICTVPACGSSSDCSNGQICSGGSCVNAPTASNVSGCDVTPNPAVVDSGKTVKLAVVAKDSTGKAVAFNSFTWTVTGGPGTIDQTGLVTATAAGTVTVGASASNSATCTGTVNVYAASSVSGTVRVVAISQFSKQPVVGATVALVQGPATTKKVTGADGAASFALVTAASYDVHVMSAGYDYFSLLGTSNTDILVPLVPSVSATSRSGFKGTLLAHCPSTNATCTDPTFTSLNVPGEAVHLAFFGSAIPGSPIDISVQTLVGQLRPVTVNVLNQTLNVKLPSGLVVGINGSATPPSTDDLFGTGTYTVNAEGGKRILWGIGGNLSLTDVAPVLTPLASGTANVDIGALVTQLLPLFNKLQAGQIVDAEAPPNGPNPTFTNVNLQLNTLLRLHAQLKLPLLPTQDGKFLGAAVALGGSLDYPLGFVPLGLTAGLSDKDSAGNFNGKVIDPTCDKSNGTAVCATQTLPIQVAPANNGLEGSKWGFIVLSANLAGIKLSGTGASASTFSLSGLVKPLDELKSTGAPAGGQVVDFTTRGFMSVPNANSAVLTVNTRQVALPAALDATAKFIRVGVQGTGGLNWNLWMPASLAGTTITLPDPAAIVGAGTADPVTDSPSSLFLAASLTNSLALADISGFGNVTLDQLGTTIDAFTLITGKVQ